MFIFKKKNKTLFIEKKTSNIAYVQMMMDVAPTIKWTCQVQLKENFTVTMQRFGAIDFKLNTHTLWQLNTLFDIGLVWRD